MSDDICKHGWSRRFCEQCSQARIIASLKGPGDKGMLANPPDELVEKVMRAMWEADGAEFKDLWADDLRAYEDQARAAIAVVLEEAVDAVGEVGDHAHLGAYINAIRAMMKGDKNE